MDLEHRLDQAKKRISKIEFLKFLQLDAAEGLVPKVQKILDENRDSLYQLYKKIPVAYRIKQHPRGHVLKRVQNRQDKFNYIIKYEINYPLKELKRKAYKEGTYNVTLRISKECAQLAKQKIDLVFDEVQNDSLHRWVGGYADWRGWQGYLELKNIIKRDIAAYIWSEAVNSKNDRNPYEPLINLYELQVMPLGIESVIFLDENGGSHAENQKFVIDFPLAKNQARSNIAKGMYVLEGKSFYGGRKLKPRDRHLLEIIKECKNGCAVLFRPEVIEHCCLATYVDSDNALKHVRYWTERLSELRPLVA